MNLRFTVGGAQNELIKCCSLAVFLLVISSVLAQSDTIKYNVSVSGITSTGSYSPFWIQSNQYGKISSPASSANLLIGINKEYGKHSKLIDYGFKANMLIQTDKTNTSIYFHELYAKARFSVFDLAIGSREEQFGNQDSTLSGGGLLFSKNSRPNS